MCGGPAKSMWAGYLEKYPQSFLQKDIGVEDNWCIGTEDTVEQLSGSITGVWSTTVWCYYWCVEYSCLEVNGHS